MARSLELDELADVDEVVGERAHAAAPASGWSHSTQRRVVATAYT